MSETPRTDAAYIASTGAGIYELFKESQDIERELNAANDRIKRLEDGDAALTYSIGLYLQKENEALKARIQRLEEAGDKMDKTAEPFVLDTIDEDIPMSDVGEQYEIIYDSPPTAGDHVAMDRARKEWRKAKEAKL